LGKVKKFYLYIIKCSDNSFYTGIATNVEKRLSNHMKGKGSKYVRSRLPFQLVYREEINSMPKALKREMEIKKMSRKEKMALL
jgi:putative endonuclease